MSHPASRTAATSRSHASSPVALVTGGSAGLGLALTAALAERGWRVITDGRDSARLTGSVGPLGPAVVAIPGDVTDPAHRRELVDAVDELGRLDLLVNNASTLGPTPLPALSPDSAGALEEVWQVNVAAPLVLTATLLPRLLSDEGVLVSISSDAAVEHYEGWGLYAASKAALDHLTLTFAAEHPGMAAYAFDPGDMRTAMHQAAFPDEDISDRPLPDAVVPRLLRLVGSRPAPGRYRASDADLVDGRVPA